MSKKTTSTVQSAADDPIIAEAWARRNPSIALDYYFRNEEGGFYVYPGSIRHVQYLKAWEAAGRPRSFTAETGEIRFEVQPRLGDFSEFVRNTPGDFNTSVAFFEKRGIVLLPWQLAFWRAPQDQRIVIGLAATGKTLSIGLMACFMCASIPNFRFLGVAPTVYQSGLMVREIRDRLVGSPFAQKFLLPGNKGYVAKPYATLKFTNGSSAEFMNVAKNADNIQSWRGDWLNLDEAGLLNGQDEVGNTELAGMLPGMITRLTGERPDGKPRLGWLTMISNAYDCDTLWELYDMGMAAETRDSYYSALVLHKDNPYITPKQLENVKRTIPPGMERSWLFGERPAKKGAEFPAVLIDQMFSEEHMRLAEEDADTVIERTRPGITTYEEPYRKDKVYIMAGDPGLGEPPYRNAPVIQVWEVTRFPHERARLVAFWWGYANGSIQPFLNKFEEYAVRYHVPENMSGYDATGPQKHMAEWAHLAGERAVVPLGFEAGKKFEYLNAAKLLMSKGLVQAPKGIGGLERQLRDYRLPDKKLSQDIVSTFCMACYLMMPLYREAYPEEWDDSQTEDMVRVLTARARRDYRPPRDRSSGRGRSLLATPEPLGEPGE